MNKIIQYLLTALQRCTTCPSNLQTTPTLCQQLTLTAEAIGRYTNDTPSGWKSFPPLRWEPYHAVHGEVVVLGLQLHGVGVVVANFCVACQEQTLVVHDPVKHLKHREWQNSHRQPARTQKQALGSLLTLKEESVAGGRPECVSAAVCVGGQLSWFQDTIQKSGLPRFKSVLSGSRREQLVAYGVLATSSDYCSISKTAALALCCNCCLIQFTHTWKESLPVSFYLSVRPSTPELSGWPPASMSCSPSPIC